jgi:hypothetical protein
MTMQTNLINVGNVVELRRKPTLVLNSPVYEINATKRKLQVVSKEEYMGDKCANGVCILEWKPNKPAA